MNSFVSLAFIALLSLSKWNQAADVLSPDNLPQGGTELKNEKSDFFHGFERFDDFLEYSPRDGDSTQLDLSDNDTLNETNVDSDDTKGDENYIDQISDSDMDEY